MVYKIIPAKVGTQPWIIHVRETDLANIKVGDTIEFKDARYANNSSNPIIFGIVDKINNDGYLFITLK